MSTCARCGSDEAEYPKLTVNRSYKYCSDCQARFREVHKNGVVIRSRHSNREFEKYPYEVAVHNDDDTDEDWRDNRNPQNQVEAIGEGKKAMEAYGLPGLFVYQKTGSVWIVEEYLDTHPSIREDVNDYLETTKSESGGFLSNLF